MSGDIAFVGPMPTQGLALRTAATSPNVRRNLSRLHLPVSLTASVLLHGGMLLAAWHFYAVENLSWRLQLQRGDNRVELMASIAAPTAASPEETMLTLGRPTKPVRHRQSEHAAMSDRQGSAMAEVFKRAPEATSRPAPEEPSATAADEFESPIVARASPSSAELADMSDVEFRVRARTRRSVEAIEVSTALELPTAASAGSTASSGADVPETPQMLRLVRPLYPPASQAAGEQGVVVLWVRVDVRGAVVDTGVEVSCGYPRLDAAAVAAMRQCRFAPSQASAPTASEFLLNVGFELRTQR